jgi:hypothetical protein
MTSIHASAPATALNPSRRSPAMLVVGLVACISSFAMLVAGVALPNLIPYPGAVPAPAANQPAAALTTVRQDAGGATEDPRLLPASGTPDSTAHRFGPITTYDHRNAEPIALGRPGLDPRRVTMRPSHCLNVDLGRGTAAESTHLATLPLQRDPREALLTLAAAQHGGPGLWSGSCLMRRLSLLEPMRADSDDRIANALVTPATATPPQRPIGPR